MPFLADPRHRDCVKTPGDLRTPGVCRFSHNLIGRRHMLCHKLLGLPLCRWFSRCGRLTSILVSSFLIVNLVVSSDILAKTANASTEDGMLLPQMEWRNIGPKRGGRVIAVAGHKDRPNEYYFGTTGGGLWKTEDGGNTWRPITDGQIRSSSVGAVAVAESNPDIVYLGMGEVQLRQNVLQGDGMYRSDDGGKTWIHIGLKETQAIGRIRIHPNNPDHVFVAALGHPFGHNCYYCFHFYLFSPCRL